MTINPTHGNMGVMLEVIGGCHLVQEGRHAIIVDEHNRLAAIEELRKDTVEQDSGTREKYFGVHYDAGRCNSIIFNGHHEELKNPEQCFFQSSAPRLICVSSLYN